MTATSPSTVSDLNATKCMNTCTSRLIAIALAVFGLVALTACAEKTFPASVQGYSHHIENSIYTFTVNGAMGSNLSTNGGGAKTSCCVVLPARWRPGLMATVEVEYSTPQGGPPPPPSRTFEVPIEEYTEEERDTLQVHFYPKGRVRIVVSKYFPGHPKYPAMEGVEVRPTSLWNYCKKVMPSDPVCKTMPKDPPQ